LKKVDNSNVAARSQFKILRIACVPEKGQFCVKKGHGVSKFQTHGEYFAIKGHGVSKNHLLLACVPEKEQFYVKKGHCIAYPNFKPMLGDYVSNIHRLHLTFYLHRKMQVMGLLKNNSEFGTPIWDQLWTPILDPDFGPQFWTPILDPDFGH
jgi:hypothetical protein